MNPRQRQVYEHLSLTPPTSDQTGWGSAYFHGYRNPDLKVEQAGPSVGHPGSEARAAFMAGRDRARSEQKAAAKAQPPE